MVKRFEDSLKYEAMDQEEYGPGAYDWNKVPEHVAIRFYGPGLGFFSYKLINNTPQKYTNNTIYIEKFVVHRDHRRKGHGTKMIDWLINRCKELNRNCLYTTIPLSNIDGAKFLSSLDFNSILGEHDFITFSRLVP